MKTSEFPSVVAARKAAEEQLSYYHRMMGKAQARNAPSNGSCMKTSEFPSVVAARKLAEEQLSYFHCMMARAEALKKDNEGKPTRYCYASGPSEFFPLPNQ